MDNTYIELEPGMNRLPQLYNPSVMVGGQGPPVTVRASTCTATLRSSISAIPTGSRLALTTRPAPKTRSKECAESASPMKQLVAGGPPPKSASSGKSRWFTKPHRWPRHENDPQLKLPWED